MSNKSSKLTKHQREMELVNSSPTKLASFKTRKCKNSKKFYNNNKDAVNARRRELYAKKQAAKKQAANQAAEAAKQAENPGFEVVPRTPQRQGIKTPNPKHMNTCDAGRTIYPERTPPKTAPARMPRRGLNALSREDRKDMGELLLKNRQMTQTELLENKKTTDTHIMSTYKETRSDIHGLYGVEADTELVLSDKRVLFESDDDFDEQDDHDNQDLLDLDSAVTEGTLLEMPAAEQCKPTFKFPQVSFNAKPMPDVSKDPFKTKKPIKVRERNNLAIVLFPGQESRTEHLKGTKPSFTFQSSFSSSFDGREPNIDFTKGASVEFMTIGHSVKGHAKSSQLYFSTWGEQFLPTSCSDRFSLGQGPVHCPGRKKRVFSKKFKSKKYLQLAISDHIRMKKRSKKLQKQRPIPPKPKVEEEDDDL